MRAKFQKLIASVGILFALLISIRVVTIQTPLNLGEQIGLMSILFDYTMKQAKRLEDENTK